MGGRRVLLRIDGVVLGLLLLLRKAVGKGRRVMRRRRWRGVRGMGRELNVEERHRGIVLRTSRARCASGGGCGCGGVAGCGCGGE